MKRKELMTSCDPWRKKSLRNAIVVGSSSKAAKFKIGGMRKSHIFVAIPMLAYVLSHYHRGA